MAGATALLSAVLLDVTKGEHAIRIVIDPRDETAEHDGLIARLAEHEATMRAAAKARLVDDLADELEGRSDLTIPALVTP